MKKKKLVLTVMWFITSILWFIMFIMDVTRRVVVHLSVLRYLCAILSYVIAMLHLVEYQEMKELE